MSFRRGSRNLFSTRSIDVALLDGLHEFEQSLRDVLHLQRYMSSDGVIFIHDCNPPTRKHAEVGDGGAWNGDVWKTVYYLRIARKYLHLVTLDCDWGVGVLKVFGPHPSERATRHESLAASRDPLIEHTKGLDYAVLENARQVILELRPPVLTRFGFFI